jgi:hypothetical protein
MMYGRMIAVRTGGAGVHFYGREEAQGARRFELSALVLEQSGACGTANESRASRLLPERCGD